MRRYDKGNFKKLEKIQEVRQLKTVTNVKEAEVNEATIFNMNVQTTYQINDLIKGRFNK
jgi:hypothetical protein